MLLHLVRTVLGMVFATITRANAIGDASADRTGVMTEPLRAETSPKQSSTKRRLLVVGVVAAAVAAGAFVLLDGDGDDGDGPHEGERQSDVTPEGFRYLTDVRGRVGTDVAFVNDDDTAHTFTSDDGLFDSGPLDTGGVFTVATLAVGEYPYHCSIHPDLTGTLVIED